MNRYIEKYNELMSKHDVLENSYRSLEMFEKKLEKLTKENEEISKENRKEFNLLVFDFLDIMIKFWKKSTFSKSKDKYEYLKKRI